MKPASVLRSAIEVWIHKNITDLLDKQVYRSHWQTFSTSNTSRTFSRLSHLNFWLSQNQSRGIQMCNWTQERKTYQFQSLLVSVGSNNDTESLNLFTSFVWTGNSTVYDEVHVTEDRETHNMSLKQTDRETLQLHVWEHVQRRRGRGASKEEEGSWQEVAEGCR